MPPLRFLNGNRILLYSAISFIAVCGVVANALKNHSNFYSLTIHLSKSSRSVLACIEQHRPGLDSSAVQVLANFGFLSSLLCGHLAQRLFFGALRPNEVEVRSLLHHFRLTHLCNLPPQRLYDRLWFFITESLLAFTIFRDEFDTPFGLMFGFLLFIKSFHWLASDRIEWVRFTSISPSTCFCKPAT